jgi:protein sidekick
MYLNFKLPELRNCVISFRYYTVQYAENSGPWQTVPERVDPQVMSYTVAGLKPFTVYRFRIQATNDIGPSGWSAESDVAQTLPAGMTQTQSVCQNTVTFAFHMPYLLECKTRLPI